MPAAARLPRTTSPVVATVAMAQMPPMAMKPSIPRLKTPTLCVTVSPNPAIASTPPARNADATSPVMISMISITLPSHLRSRQVCA